MPGLFDSFKEHGATELALLLIDSIDPVQLRQQIEAAVEVELRLSKIANAPASNIALVPVPSSAEAFRVRGFAPANEVAKALACALRLSGAPVRVIRLLKRSRAVSDQATLATEARWQNQIESMAARHDFDGQVILVDDIVTTGATLVEAKRAVEAAGAQVIGFCTLAETLLKRNTNSAKANT